MVRLKSRYILFEILYPDRAPLSQNDHSITTTILNLHQQSSDKLTAKHIITLIRASLSKNFGDYGSSTAIPISLKYFSTRTSTGILRINRENVRFIVASLTFISSVLGENCIINCVSISGSIKKCEDRSIERSKELMKLINRNSTDGGAALDDLFKGAEVDIDEQDEQ